MTRMSLRRKTVTPPLDPRISALEEEIRKARQYRMYDVPYNSLDERLDQLESRLGGGLEEKIIVFNLSGGIADGMRSHEIMFPGNGHISDIYASCVCPGETVTEIQIEKCTQNDFDHLPIWRNVLREGIKIDANEKSSRTSTGYVIEDDSVSYGDHFCVVVQQAGRNIVDITVEIRITLVRGN